ncbi:MAG: hypothetical protein KF906_12055 [Actinobacteria bacterium]|nr:hypothetical protein [Actinomycetota bacterium]
MPDRARMRAAGRRAISLVALASIATMSVTACGSDDGDSQSFCAALRSAPTLESVVSGFTALDGPELTRRLDRAAAAYDTVERTAPSEVDDEVETVVAVVDAVIEAVRNNPDDRRGAVAAVRTAISDHPDLDASAATIATYAHETCDLDLNPGVAPGSTTTTVVDG